MKYKGILFDDIHTFDDLNLILSVCPDMPPAKPKTTYIDIPGADGSLDLSEAHGEIRYSDRENQYTFTMLPDDSTTWEEKMTEVSNLLNGKRMKMTLDKDEDYYWDVRVSINSYESDKNLHQIVISVKALPYKFKQWETKSEFKLTGESQTVYLTNGRKSVCPVIECSNSNTYIAFDSIEATLSAGRHEILDIQFKEGTNKVVLKGSGTVLFSYREGDL